MRKLIVATMVLTLSGLSPALARGGMHGGGTLGGMHGGGMLGAGMHHSMGLGLANPANPTVPPSLTPDPRLIGSAPLPPHQQPTPSAAGTLNENLYNPTPDEAALDKKIGSICKGC
ncbi:hypothetical protein V1291_001474 [Nitrobacteraceae bacterium AZCC 1564]